MINTAIDYFSSNRIQSHQILVYIVLIFNNFLTVNFFSPNITINLKSLFFAIIDKIALYPYLAQHVAFHRVFLIVLIWINIGEGKHKVHPAYL